MKDRQDWMHWMGIALDEAQQAYRLGEVPVGAAVILDGECVARAGNRRESLRDPLAHAELLVLREAARKLGRWRLSGCSLIVSLEPCCMCAGGIIAARLDTVVFAARDERTGAGGSIYNLLDDSRLNHSPQVVEGIREEESRALLQSFFKELRAVQARLRLVIP
ncbi:MAG: nucleoside deaminase [Myxococcota bacterium]|nr:nucleoside deaminase [Myxococcota bacterium]